jgi:tetratricopeptide (TPR) repeat protein
MDTAPWNYWEKDGSPRTFTPEVLASLESVLSRKPDHAGAIHLYIHAVEASSDPARAEPYADRLAALIPGAGHIVHMPAHIYLRVGRFADASRANQEAIKADEAYFSGDAVAGDNGWSLSGLQTSLERQDRKAEAAAVKVRFMKAWRAADGTVVAGRPRAN